VSRRQWAVERLIVERGLIWCGGEGVARRRTSSVLRFGMQRWTPIAARLLMPVSASAWHQP